MGPRPVRFTEPCWLGFYMRVMFSHGSCVWVRLIAGQLDKQQSTCSCQDVMCAGPKAVSFFVLTWVWADFSTPYFIALLSSAQNIDIVTLSNFFCSLEFYLQKCVRCHDSVWTQNRVWLCVLTRVKLKVLHFSVRNFVYVKSMTERLVAFPNQNV